MLIFKQNPRLFPVNFQHSFTDLNFAYFMKPTCFLCDISHTAIRSNLCFNVFTVLVEPHHVRRWRPLWFVGVYIFLVFALTWFFRLKRRECNFSLKSERSTDSEEMRNKTYLFPAVALAPLFSFHLHPYEKHPLFMLKVLSPP